MGRAYGKKTIEKIEAALAEQLAAGTVTLNSDFAMTVIKARLGLDPLAKYFGVSRMSIYNWLTGKKIKAKFEQRMESLIAQMKDDIERGVLPLKKGEDPEVYLGIKEVPHSTSVQVEGVPTTATVGWPFPEEPAQQVA